MTVEFRIINMSTVCCVQAARIHVKRSNGVSAPNHDVYTNRIRDFLEGRRQSPLVYIAVPQSTGFLRNGSDHKARILRYHPVHTVERFHWDSKAMT